MIALPVYMVTVSGEIPLRSPRTRPRFYSRLVENIKDAVARAGGVVEKIEIIEAKLLVSTDKEVGESIARVFGVHRVGRVLTYEFKDLGDLVNWIYQSSRHMVEGKSFAVRVKRSGSHAFTSLDVAREAGALLKQHALRVDLEHPEVVIEVEVRGNKAYLYTTSINGPGGLPIGVEGSALVLFSGGFDSPIAAWLTAKRGVRVDFLHYVMGSIESTYNAFEVARYLYEKWLYGYRPRFIIIDLRELIREVAEKVKWSLRQVTLRALMYIIADQVARVLNHDAIVTGESIGQASSQTLRNISAIEATVLVSKPILRPLAGLDKEEIIAYSRRIGLYELSARVIETCSIAPRRVETSARVEDIRRELEKINRDLVDKVLANMKILDLASARPEDSLVIDDIEIDFIPRDAIVIDLRDINERQKRPIPNALPFENTDITNLPRDKVIVFVCETGTRSYFIARSLRESGFKSFSLKGGLRSYCRLVQ